jgi:hypothetical protein
MLQRSAAALKKVKQKYLNKDTRQTLATIISVFE